MLGVVQALILAHIALWLASRELGWFGGRTLSPVEPSEAMQSLELGYINAGLIFFSLALLSTLVFGRWFCGWACHLVLLQDGCGWLMKKMGVTPRPFRSRVLVWVPFLLALYMFVWPTFKRLALFPILESLWPSAMAWLEPVAPWGGWSNHLVTADFWATFAVLMAIPTLALAGFASVYFLGSKGFCTYGCPYGGFFAPLDEFAPGRIRVDHDKCEGCGHCTAVCTSNVRVHEEVREFGMVVDPGCMKCLDCVSVCPNDALAFRFGKPAVRKGKARTGRLKKKQYDLSAGEDAMLAGVFLGAFLAVRGWYLGEPVPLLMAVALAGILAFAVFKSWRVLRGRDEIVRVQNLNLKWRGRVTRAGWAFLALTGIVAALAVQNGAVNAVRFLGERREATALEFRDLARMPANFERPRLAMEASAGAIAVLEKARGLADGGWALFTDPEVDLRLMRLREIRGEFDEAERLLRGVIARGRAADVLLAEHARVLELAGRPAEALDAAKKAWNHRPKSTPIFDTLVHLTAGIEGNAAAIELCRRTLRARPEYTPAMRALGSRLLEAGETGEALMLAQRAIQARPEEAANYHLAAALLFQTGRLADAAATLELAVARFPEDEELRRRLAAVRAIAGEE